MHYLICGSAFAFVEDDEQARKHVEAGWQLASRAEVMVLWRKRDRATLNAMKPRQKTVIEMLRERGVGHIV